MATRATRVEPDRVIDVINQSSSTKSSAFKALATKNVDLPLHEYDVNRRIERRNSCAETMPSVTNNERSAD
jgi:hypothetical protein